ncbi:MAG TPA: hypothetical protein VJ487_14710 [Alphaproteobacteria bacterium]|nr:hypothetical protein [Alphaproteobacteria bacterium]
MTGKLSHSSASNANASPTGIARRIVGYFAGVVGVLLLAASAFWWRGEAEWGRFEPLTPEQAFAEGSFGLELAPLKYILVASNVSATALGTSWIRRFGFLSRKTPAAGACEADAPQNLPVGFTVSNRLPGSATPLPVKFVGLSCAACHAASIGESGPILGVGTQTADVIGFTDAFLNAVLDPALNSKIILGAYDRQCPGEASGFRAQAARWVEAFFIDRWLSGVRAQTRENVTKYDLPYHGAELGSPDNIPTGPSRTRPFRSVVRNTLDLPGAKNIAYSKVPLAAMQGLKRWSQFDGSIGDPVVRSMIAVFTSGASLAALNEPQISDNIVKAAAYTLRRGIDPPLPSLAETFPNRPKPSAETLEKGHLVYVRACDGCHGHPNGAGWSLPSASGDPPSITPLPEIGTDPGRIIFRYADMLPIALSATLPAADVTVQREALVAQSAKAIRQGDLAQADWWNEAIIALEARSREFPAGHRRAFPAGDVTQRDGYQNAPIPFIWLRAPYLHNGSVPTVRQLIGLDERPTRFCRGDAGYDPIAIGVIAPPPGANGCDSKAPFLFDTTQPGNSNAGHLHPPPGTVAREELEALLAYVGTL